VDAIERIEVVKGPGSVLYGSTAFSGVINIITEKPEQNGFSATGLGGEEGAYGFMGDWKYRAGEFNLLAAARYFEKADWPMNYVSPGAGGVGTIVTPITVPNKGVGAFLDASYKEWSLMASFDEWKNAYFIPDFEFLFPSIGMAKWDKFFSNLGYDKEVTDHWRTTVNLTATRSQFRTDLFPYVKRDSYEALLEWANFITLCEKSKLTLGGLATKLGGSEWDTSTGTRTSSGQRLDFGLYGQVDYQVWKNLKVIAGAQANKIENINWDVVPRGGVIWYPVPRLNVKALYGMAYRAPSINETHLNNIGLHGDPNLKSEHVGTIDLGINYEGDKAEIGVNFFRSELTDIIYQNRMAFPVYANQPGTITIEGAELEGKYYITKELFLTGSFLYQTSHDETGNKNLSPLANYGTKFGISYACPNGFTASLFDIYQGPLDSKYDATLNPSPGPYNRLDLHLEFNLNKFFHWKVSPESSLIVQADNLLDKQIWLPAWGLAPGHSIPYEQGRAVYAGVRFRF
jgi:outer membrane receptor protein involved in Fe transport